MADTTRDLNEEIGEERATQYAGQPAQPLDSTTLLAKRLVTLRTATTDNDDLNTVIDIVLPD